MGTADIPAALLQVILAAFQVALLLAAFPVALPLVAIPVALLLVAIPVALLLVATRARSLVRHRGLAAHLAILVRRLLAALVYRLWDRRRRLRQHRHQRHPPNPMVRIVYVRVSE